MCVSEKVPRKYYTHHVARHVLGRVVVTTKLVGETSVGVREHVALRLVGETLEKRLHLRRTERAVKANGKRLRMANRNVKRLTGLPRERAAAHVDDRAGHENGHTMLACGFHLVENLADGKECGLRRERAVEVNDEVW